MTSPTRPVALSLRLYRALARAFPHEFKNIYGDDIVQLTEDAIDSIWRRAGLPGLLRLLCDIAIRIPAEYLSEIRHDVRYGWRVLAASWGVTAVAVLSLSLGIAISTCAYSEMRGLVLRDLPQVSAPDELIGLQTPVSFPAFRRYRDLPGLFSSTSAYIAPVPFGISTSVHTERIWGNLVTPSYFATLGLRPFLGRFFEETSEQPGQAPVAVISYRFWQNHLASDPAAVGKQLRVNGHPATILGVGPREFVGAAPNLYTADLWMPIWTDPAAAPELANHALDRRDLAMFQFLARLKPGVAAERAEAALDTAARKFDEDYGVLKTTDRKGRRLSVVQAGRLLPIRKQDLPLFSQFFFVIAGLVLLIACTNVANILFARAADRRKEIAVRLALGASRARLVRQLLIESLLVAAGAGGIGFATAVWLMTSSSNIRMPWPMAVTYDLRPDWHAFLLTLCLTFVAGIILGLAPALQATRTDLTPALKDCGNLLPVRSRRWQLRNLLMLSQVAGSLALLLLTGNLSIGIQNTLQVQQGFDPQNLYLVSIDPVRDGYTGPRAADFLSKLLDRVQGLPSVATACLTDTVPVSINGGAGLSFSAAGSSAAPRALHRAARYMVGKDYFETTGIRILQGRGFRRQDEGGAGSAVVVTEALVNVLWPGEDPVGRSIEIGSGESGKSFGLYPGTFDYRPGGLGEKPLAFEIVGVARDLPAPMVVRRPDPAIYFPMRSADYAQPGLLGVTMIVRAVPGADALREVQHELAALDPSVTPFRPHSMAAHIDQFMAPLKIGTWTYRLIGIFGLILSAVGLAGVTAYAVTQRRREIGIRVALGARRANILSLVMSQGARLVFLGTVIGMTLAWAGMRALAGLFAVVSQTAGDRYSEPVLLIGAPLLLGLLALLACYLPARRSLRIDPAIALRHE